MENEHPVHDKQTKKIDSHVYKLTQPPSSKNIQMRVDEGADKFSVTSV